MATMHVPVAKVKGATIEVNTDDIPAPVYEYAILLGLKAILGRGMTGIRKENFKNDAEYNTAVMAKAEEQLKALYAGKTRIVGAKASKQKETKEYTEAVRLAKIKCREEYKVLAAADKSLPRVSHIKAADWTTAAKKRVDSDRDTWLAAARESLSRAAMATGGDFDITKVVHADEALVKKAEAKKAAAKKEKASPQATAAGKAKAGTKPGQGKPAH